MIAVLLDHLWQSTLFAGAVALSTLLFRRNGAGLRFWLWFAASVKFLLPFALLALVGEHLSRLFPATLPRALLAIQPAAEKWSAPAQAWVVRQAEPVHWAPLLLGGWLLGLAFLLALRLLRWARLRSLTAGALELAVAAQVPVKASASLLEPGLVGILRPVVLLPEGLLARLSEPERDSILAHEFSHLRRRDNITAAVHMLVEALFWFHPLVWLIGGRLIAERERACDESVLALGHDPEIYAGGILKVCKFCVQSPLACASGVSGSDLKQRVRTIMACEAVLPLGVAKRLLLAAMASTALALPIAAGFLGTPLAASVTRKVFAVQTRAERAVTAVVEGIARVPKTPVRAKVAAKRLPKLKLAVEAAPPPLPVSAPPAAVAAPLETPVESALASMPVSATRTETAAQPSTREALLALNPVGTGDPDAITCRLPQQLPGSRLAGPMVCQLNRVWAQLHAHRQDISPDGKMIVYGDDFQRQRAMASDCRNAFFTGGGPANLLAGSSSTYCF